MSKGPTKLTPAKRVAVIAAFRSHGSHARVARACRVSERSLYTWKAADPELAQAIEEARRRYDETTIELGETAQRLQLEAMVKREPPVKEAFHPDTGKVVALKQPFVYDVVTVGRALRKRDTGYWISEPKEKGGGKSFMDVVVELHDDPGADAATVAEG